MRFFALFTVLISALLSACGGPGNTSTITNTTTQPAPPPSNAFRVSTEGKHASEANVAAASDGRVFVLWSERDESKKYDIFVREYSADLEAKGEPVRVNPNPGEARTWYGDAPSILVSPDGKIYVGWNRVYADGSAGNDLMLSTSNDGGKTFGEAMKINDDTEPASHGMHGMTLDAEGRVLISWLDERYLKKTTARLKNGGPFMAMFFHHTPTPAAKQPESEEPDAELYFAIVADGKLTGPNRRIAEQVCPCCRVSLAAADGTVYVAYRKVFPGQFRHIAVSSSADRGETFAAPVQVSDDQWKLYACPVTGAALRTQGSELEIVWYSGGDRAEKGVYRTTSADRGKTFSAPQFLSNTMLKGSPTFAGTSLIFGDNEKIYRGSGNSFQQIANGTTPSAAISNTQTIITYASGDPSSLWITK